MIPVHFEKSTVNWRKPGAMFKCSTCGTTRQYHILITWLFFKLYGVPLLPLKRYASVIECDSCRNVFNPVPNSARNRADRINRNLGMVYGGLVVVVPIIWIGYLLGVGQRPLAFRP